MRFVLTAITAFAVLGILDLISFFTIPKKKQKTDKFTVNAPAGLAIIGALDMLIIMIPTYFLAKNDNLSILAVIIAIIISCIGIPLMLGPVKGFWTIEVNGDDIFITKFFLIHKHFRFSELSHWNGGNGHLNVYTKNGERFLVDGMAIGSDTFERRLKKEGIPVG